MKRVREREREREREKRRPRREHVNQKETVVEAEKKKKKQEQEAKQVSQATQQGPPSTLALHSTPLKTTLQRQLQGASHNCHP